MNLDINNAYSQLGKAKFRGDNVYPIIQNNKVGFINKDGNIVIDPKLDDMIFDDEGMIAFRDNGSRLWGYMDSSFNVVFKPQIDHISPKEFNEGLAVYCGIFDSKYGYIDKLGNIAINPRFMCPNSFKDNYATVSINDLKARWNEMGDDDHWGVINSKGDFIVEPQYDFLKNNGNGIFTASKDGLCGCIDKYGDIVIPFVYEGFNFYGFGNGFSYAKYKNKWGVIDINNNVIIDFKIDDRYDIRESTDSIEFQLPLENVRAHYYNKKWVLFDKNGLPLKTLKGYYIIAEYINGYARAITGNGEEQLIDVNGRIIYSCVQKYTSSPGAFSEGLAAVNTNDTTKMNMLSGYIDCDGEFVIQPKFDLANPFCEGYAVVGFINVIEDKFKNKYGIIDKRGNYLVEPSYNLISRFYNGVASVVEGDSFSQTKKYGYINTSGQLIYKPES